MGGRTPVNDNAEPLDRRALRLSWEIAVARMHGRTSRTLKEATGAGDAQRISAARVRLILLQTIKV